MAFAAILKRLEMRLEHGSNLWALVDWGNAAQRPVAAREDERGPAVELDAALQRERVIGGALGICLRGQEARENDAAAGCHKTRERGREPLR